MSGNVWEWCQDWSDTYPSSAQHDPQGPSSGTGRVFRGGSCGWDDDAKRCRVSFRDSSRPGGRGSTAGFRLALSL